MATKKPATSAKYLPVYEKLRAQIDNGMLARPPRLQAPHCDHPPPSVIKKSRRGMHGWGPALTIPPPCRFWGDGGRKVAGVPRTIRTKGRLTKPTKVLLSVLSVPLRCILSDPSPQIGARS